MPVLLVGSDGGDADRLLDALRRLQLRVGSVARAGPQAIASSR